MLSENDEDEYNDALCASLNKFSTEIGQDLTFQWLNSKSDVHCEELCGWTVTPADLNRFRWNSQRKVPKTPTKDLKVTRRTNFRSEIEFEFKHYRHLSNYIEQYRYTKQQKVDSVLSQSDPKKSDICDHCSKTSSFEAPKSDSPSLNVGFKSNSKPTQLFRGALYGNRVFQSKEASIPENGALQSKASKQPISLNEESWAVIGVEKRRLPVHTKPRVDMRTRARQQINVNKSDTLLKNKTQDTITSSAFKGLRNNCRSNSAPNIGSFSRHWQNERKTESSIAEVDYSSYTEMFKNVLEYYGTKKLKPKQKPDSAGSVRILSIKS